MGTRTADFNSYAEAKAFVAGVEFVNDSALTVVAITEGRYPESGAQCFTVTMNDEDDTSTDEE
jgi:hypothetical protein